MRELLRATTQTQLFDGLARLECEPPAQVRILVAGCREPVHSLASSQAPFALRIERRDDFFVGAFNYLAGELRLKGEVFFCSSTFGQILYLVSVCSATVWERSIMRLAGALYPALVPIFFSQDEVLELLKGAKAVFPKARLRITGHMRKKRLKRGTRRKYESSRTRTEKTLEAVFREAEDQNFWFHSVSFDYRPERNQEVDSADTLACATLSKYGSFFCTSNFGRFLHGIVHEMTRIADAKLTFFADRSRRSVQRFEARPIAITFDSSAFKSGDDNKHFVGILQKMPGISCSVLHSNPYIHLSVKENADGSGIDLWVLKNDEVMLVPQLKASEAALKRLVNYIFEEWREGQVSSAGQTRHAVRPQGYPAGNR